MKLRSSHTSSIPAILKTAGRLGSFLILAFLFAAGLAQGGVLDPLYPSGTWHYRMTVTVETPEGLKTGSAVREVAGYCGPEAKFSGGGCHVHLVKGEAVVVDLGKRGVLFALMRGGKHGDDYATDIVFDAFPFSGPLTKEGIRYYRELKSQAAILSPENYPVFVHFSNARDPKSIEILYLRERYSARDDKGNYIGEKDKVTDRFESILGPRVKIKEVKIEMSHDNITNRIQHYLPSFGPETGYMKWYRSLKFNSPLRILPNSFLTREKS